MSDTASIRFTVPDNSGAFQMVEATPHLVLYGGKICTQERCIKTGAIRYIDVTEYVRSTLTQGGDNGR